MTKRTWINVISVLAGIVVVGGIILAKNRPSPKPSSASKARSPEVAAKPSPTPRAAAVATPMPKGTPGPTATPTPLVIEMLTEEQVGKLREYLQLVADQKSALEEEMLPPVERLYQRDEEMVFRWADQADWPVQVYKAKLQEFEEERAPFLPLLPESYRQLDQLLQNAGETLIEGANAFKRAPGAPKEFPPMKLAALKDLFEQIDQVRTQLLQEL